MLAGLLVKYMSHLLLKKNASLISIDLSNQLSVFAPTATAIPIIIDVNTAAAETVTVKQVHDMQSD